MIQLKKYLNNQLKQQGLVAIAMLMESMEHPLTNRVTV